MRAGGKHNDLDNVGFTARHHTFFEMLGNFSFGDYFKEEAIAYAWEWVTKELKLPVDRLYATVYDTDDEAFELWEKIAPELKNGRIMRFGKHDNYWSMGDIGPNGPCSELHFDRGAKYGTGPDDVINGETDRFVEIWNLVFMQYDTQPDGTVIDLPKPSVDTGAGLERIAAIMQGCDSNYGIDLFQNLVKAVSDLTGANYQDNVSSHHVVADHIRALTFALADGAGISNEGRGYVLRRILRRASRHGRELGATDPFLYKLVPTLVDEMGAAFPEIREKQLHVANVIKAEEESFLRTLDAGIERVFRIAEKHTNQKRRFEVNEADDIRPWISRAVHDLIREEIEGKNITIDGRIAFEMYDTFGFPLDLIQIEASKYGMAVDTDGFEKAMAEQQERSKAASGFATGEDKSQRFIDLLKEQGLGNKPPTTFEREYMSVETDMILAAFDPFPQVAVVLEETPFYVEAGGQIGDEGRIYTNDLEIEVSRVINHQGWYVHIGKAVKGHIPNLMPPKEVTAELSAQRRWDIMRNHTATHLAHAALRTVLGEHVKQSGSYVGPDRLRFDFSHHQPMTPEEIAEVERIVNDQILAGQDVTTDIMDLDQAKKAGAMALFGEKYADKVRVVSVPGFSMELCGGTHVNNVSQIGPFFVTLETGIASGVRRLEAITGREAQRYMLQAKQTIERTSQLLGRPEAEVMDGIEQLRKANSDLQKELKKVKADLVSGAGQSLGDEVTIGEVGLWRHSFGDTDRDTMSAWIDSRKEQADPVVALGVGNTNGKTTVMVGASAAAIKEQKLHIGKLTGTLLGKFGGRGGGKPNFAQGGVPDGTQPEDIFKELEALLNDIKEEKR
ncbi:alanine--tRNA ligase [candidate division GN15 bacterium]|nr:alanine--tRNA ligase [candidate division GN15 bacterium]